MMALYAIQGAYSPTVQASIPLLVQGEKLVSANAVVNLVNSLSNRWRVGWSAGKKIIYTKNTPITITDSFVFCTYCVRTTVKRFCYNWLCIITAACFFAMIAGVLMRVQLFAFIQQAVPKEMIGKVFSYLMAIILYAQPVGQWIAGWCFERFADLPWVVLLVAVILSSIISIYSRSCFHKIIV